MKLEDVLLGTSIKFGTSGARGLADEFTDKRVIGITLAFISFVKKLDGAESALAIGGDLRPSSGRMMTAAARAVELSGLKAINCGFLPSPALADFGFRKNLASVMITGSHIPDDRNGIKLVKHSGELLKSEEPEIWKQEIDFGALEFDSEGNLIGEESSVGQFSLDKVEPQASEDYISRYTSSYSRDALSGLRVGVYQHSAVGREVMVEILSALGADVVKLGFSETFVPVDTEAIRPEDHELALKWSKEHSLDAIVSTDGDSDRPLVADENGKWFRGDVLGVLVAKSLGANAVVTPVSCNTLVEKSGFFKHIDRTKIGSPYVIDSMNRLAADGLSVVGYEANGGFLTASSFKGLSALPTRDALVVQIEMLVAAKEKGVPLSGLLEDLPARYTASDRLKEFPTEKSQEIIKSLETTPIGETLEWLEKEGPLTSQDKTDGLRLVLENSEIVHIRPSGNAPELRCYAEADREERAEALVSLTLEHLASL